MPRIVALWAVPRSTSTAFEWMMRQRGDIDCLHEPFGEAWYQGEAPLWPRATADSVRTPGLTLAGVRADLEARAAAGPLFIKDFPHFIDHMWDAALFDLFTHSFLIRDPAKTLTLMHDKWPEFHAKEVGFPEQRALFDRVVAATGRIPPVIDSDDLLARPVEIVRAWCAAVGLPFIEAALSWTPGARDEVSWWDGGSFHANLRNSDGLKPQDRTAYVDIEAAPAWMRCLHDEMLPHYSHLHRHRLA